MHFNQVGNTGHFCLDEAEGVKTVQHMKTQTVPIRWRDSVVVSALDYHSNGRGSNPGRGRIEVKSAARHPARRPGVGYKL